MMNAKDYEAEWKWMNSSPEAKQRSDAAKAQAFSEFKKRFPRADVTKFIAQVDFDANRKATGRVLFPDGDGSWENPLIEDQKYWSQPLKDALGVNQDGGFPYQLSLSVQNKPPPVPAIDFSESKTGQSVADFLNKEMRIYVTPTDYFTTKFRKIFNKPRIEVTSSKYARPWIKSPNMSFWQQQLNFALWCATTGCGVSREMLFPNSSLNLSDQLRTFYQFHVYYTTRKILFSSGLTPRGLGRINRSIEAFGYCILGAQANTRSSIIGTTGTAINTQTDFLVLVDNAIRTLTVSSEPVKYQTAIELTKVRLNFAVARGVLLLPSRMIINTESVVGYNNNLRRTTDDMKLGVNNQVNQGTKKSSLKLMAGGPSKVNPSNSHPSNPIHKQAVQAQGLAPTDTQPTGEGVTPTLPPQAPADTSDYPKGHPPSPA